MNPPITELAPRLLVIDDHEGIRTDFCRVLAPAATSTDFGALKAAFLRDRTPAGARPRRRFQVDTANQGEEGLAKVQAAVQGGAPYLMAFVDMRMPPGWDGPTTIRKLWEADPGLQVVICTAHSDQALDAVVDELGRSDQLLVLKKPFDAVEVYQLAAALVEKRRAHNAAALKLDELERLVQERTAEIEHAMLHDKLTGLPNRTLLLTRLETCIQRRARQPNSHSAVLFLDFDRFKLINDSLGHDVGDLLLIEVAARLRNNLRTGDLVSLAAMPGRLGGDEFVVLLEDLREQRDAARVAQRLLDVLAEPYTLAEQKLLVTASIGIATSERGYGRAEEMLRDADTAMYRAKVAGRARYVMFDSVMHEEVLHRLALENALRQAVRDEQIDLHFQPIVRLTDGQLTGFEALVRWTDPTLGPVPAATLIACAEETGLIQPLSLSVLRRACRLLNTWEQRFPDAGGLMMNVNLSRRLLLDPELVTKVAATIRESGVASNRLVLEITESTIIGDQRDAVGVLRELQQLGVWLHLDDFGTGYSSLSCLYTLPLSGLKIDRSFIQETLARSEHAIVLRAIVEIARAFHLEVVAEGVENTEQLALLRSLGVDFGQGYLLGEPVCVEQAEALLQDMPVCCVSR